MLAKTQIISKIKRVTYILGTRNKLDSSPAWEFGHQHIRIFFRLTYALNVTVVRKGYNSHFDSARRRVISCQVYGLPTE